MSSAPVNAEDLYLYAMGLLDPQEHVDVDALLMQSPDARAELVHVRSDLGLLALSVETQAPSPDARQRLMDQVARESRTAVSSAAEQTVVHKPVPVADPTFAAVPAKPEDQAKRAAPLPFRSPRAQDSQPTSRGVLGVITPWLGWAVAAGLAVTTWSFHQKAQTLSDQVASANAASAQAMEASAKATASSARAQAVLDTMRSRSSQHFLLIKQNTQPIPSARVTYLASSGSLIFQGNDMDPLPARKTYELWLIPSGEGRKPIAAGTFKPDERGYASVILPDLPKGVSAGSFGVTMEDDGGSRTPTLPILMVGSK